VRANQGPENPDKIRKLLLSFVLNIFKSLKSHWAAAPHQLGQDDGSKH
jgi:hypothetical protein